jgi:hypothetical protein
MYELWDLRSGNAIGGFRTEGEALAAVRVLVDEHGRAYVEHLSLVREDEEGDTTPIAQGSELVALSSAQPRGERVTA